MKPILNEDIFKHLKHRYGSFSNKLLKDDVDIQKIGSTLIYVIEKFNVSFFVLTEESDINRARDFHLSACINKNCFENYGLLNEKEFSLIVTIHANHKEVIVENVATNIELYLALQNLIIRLNKYFDISAIVISDFVIVEAKENSIVLKIMSYSKLKPKKKCKCETEEIPELSCKYCNHSVMPSLEYFLNYQHWYVCTNCLEKH